MTIRNISQFVTVLLFSSVPVCEIRGTIFEFSLDRSPLSDLAVGTCEYAPTKIEKQFYDRLGKAGRVTLQTKPREFKDASYRFKLQGHRAEFVSWFGIVRDIKRNPDQRLGILLIENKYSEPDNYTDCHIQTVQINGAGDFKAEVGDIPNDLIPLVLVRVYGVVKKEQNNRPLIKADTSASGIGASSISWTSEKTMAMRLGRKTSSLLRTNRFTE